MRSPLLQSLRAGLRTLLRAFADTTPAFILPDGFVALRTRADTPDVRRCGEHEDTQANPSASDAGLSLPHGTDRTERRQCRPLPA